MVNEPDSPPDGSGLADADAAPERRDVERDVARERVRAQVLGGSLDAVRIGRFAMLQQVGAGAMGIVYAGYDDTLDRKVAIKLLRGETDRGSKGEQRMLREAQALAKLSHSNVVQVYEAGMHEGTVFIAMEFVRGQTLTEWAPSARPWREILEVYEQAGRGLAAAHEAGLVHRDFKPDNAMIDESGQVRVTDFGLARRGDVKDSGESQPDLRHASSADLAESLTQTGALVGTPAYMSPEQMRGTEADARSDQFSFCVALWEALYGERPFSGTSLAEQVTNVIEGRVRPPPRQAGIPTWLARAIQRGLSVDPRDRWPTVEALLAELRVNRRARRRRALTGVGLLGLGAAVASMFAWGVGGDTTCVPDPDRFTGVWDDTVRAEVDAAFEATGRPHAPGTSTRVAARLNHYVVAWHDQWTDACTASERGEQSPEVLDLRMSCLAHRHTDVTAATRLLRHEPENAVVDNALRMVSGLPGIARCGDVDGLRQAYPPPESTEDQVEAERLTAALSAVSSLQIAGSYERATSELIPLLERARTLGYPPVLAEALHLRGTLLHQKKDHAEAVPILREAARVAATARADRLVGRAWLKLTAAVTAQGDYDQARDIADMAEVASARAGSPAELEGTLANRRGIIARRTGDYRAAMEQFERARARWAESGGPESEDVAAALTNLGLASGQSGNITAAIGYGERALELYERRLGPQHPRLAPVLSNLGALSMDMGHPERARAFFERSLKIDTETRGHDHPDVAYSLLDLGLLEESQGRCDDAIDYFERSLAIWTRARGKDHPALAGPLTGLGNCHEERGEYAEARVHHERALELTRKDVGDEHPAVARILTNLGVVAEAQDEHDEARRYHEQALEIRRASLGDDHPETSNSYRNLAFVSVHERKWDESHQLYLRALPILVATYGTNNLDVAVTHRELAKICLELERPEDARRHYGAALEIYQALGHDEDASTLRAELAGL